MINHILIILSPCISFLIFFSSHSSFEKFEVVQKVKGGSSPLSPAVSPGYMCRTTVILITLKDGSLQINSLTSDKCFSYRNVFQNDVNALSKMINHFLSKFCVVSDHTILLKFHQHACGANTYQYKECIERL